jgi:hypothetical protein
MEAGNWIALYATIVSTAALAWQAAVRVRERRLRLRVRVGLVHLLGEEDIQACLAKPDVIFDAAWFLEGTVLNLGYTPVRITDVSFETGHGSNGLVSWTSGDWGLPWVLEPGEERPFRLSHEEVGEGIARGTCFVAYVATSRGKHFRSKELVVGAESPDADELVAFPHEHAPNGADKFFTMQVRDFAART